VLGEQGDREVVRAKERRHGEQVDGGWSVLAELLEGEVPGGGDGVLVAARLAAGEQLLAAGGERDEVAGEGAQDCPPEPEQEYRRAGGGPRAAEFGQQSRQEDREGIGNSGHQ